jgi:hypothetical protein
MESIRVNMAWLESMDDASEPYPDRYIHAMVLSVEHMLHAG